MTSPALEITLALMFAALCSLIRLLVLPDSVREMALENLALRQQLTVFKRRCPRPRLRKADRWFWLCLSKAWKNWRRALIIFRPETVVAWHRKDFRLFWTWISRRKHIGRPEVSPEIRALIGKMAAANPFWGAPRIHGELLKLGIQISERSVSRLLSKNRRPPSQTGKTFLDSHLNQLVSIDFFTVPTATFRVLLSWWSWLTAGAASLISTSLRIPPQPGQLGKSAKLFRMTVRHAT